MSLMLNQGTVPNDLFTKSHPSNGGRVLIGDYDLSMKDFVALAEYVLTNTDLQPDDPRLEFMDYVKTLVQTDDPRLELAENVKRMAKTKGHNRRRKRLALPE